MKPLYLYRTFVDEESKDWVAENVDIPYLCGVGDTEREAIASAKEATDLYLDTLEEAGISFPPSTILVSGDII